MNDSTAIIGRQFTMPKPAGVLVLVLLLAALTLAAVGVPVSAADSSSCTINVSLYAHVNPNPGSGEGPILNGAPQYGPQQAAFLQRGPALFTLNPPLGGNVTIDGTAVIRIWVRADNSLLGNLIVYLTEDTPDGQRIPVGPTFNDTVILNAQSRNNNYLVTINNFTLTTGSTIQLHVGFSSADHVTGAYLLYDNGVTPTQITVPIKRIIDFQTHFTDSEGNPKTVFQTATINQNASINILVNITDKIGLYRLKNIHLRIANVNGSAFLETDLLQVQGANPYSAAYGLKLTAPEGSYTVTTTVRDQVGNSCQSATTFSVSVFYTTAIWVTDPSRRPVVGAVVTFRSPYSNYSATTNQTGWATFSVPSSRIVGQYHLSVSWKNLTVLQVALPVINNVTFTARPLLYDLTVHVRLLLFDLPGARVDLLSNSTLVDSRVSNITGAADFAQIAERNYTVNLQYLGATTSQIVSMRENTEVTIQVPVPFKSELLVAGIVAIGLAATGVVLRRRRLYESPFDYFSTLTRGSFPESLSATITGSTGSGKTVLMQSLLNRSLQEGRACIYVTNVDLPENIRTAVQGLGMDFRAHESNGRLIFIDCYSALSGQRSNEKRSLGSLTDLTSLGILITTATEELKGATDVYFDSLTPLLTMLKGDYMASFLQSTSAKVKGNNGRLFTTIGTSVEKDTLSKVEEMSDCVIETQLLETRSGQKRRLRIKKLRAHPYSDSWTPFKITGTGISFMTRKPYNKNDRETDHSYN